MNLSGADTGVFDGGALLGLFLATVLFEKLMKAMNHFPGKNKRTNRHATLHTPWRVACLLKTGLRIPRMGPGWVLSWLEHHPDTTRLWVPPLVRINQ